MAHNCRAKAPPGQGDRGGATSKSQGGSNSQTLCSCLSASGRACALAGAPTTCTLWPTTAEQQLRQGREIEVALPKFGSSNPQNFEVAEHAHSQKTSLGDGGQ